MANEISETAKGSALASVNQYFITEAEKYFRGSSTVSNDIAKQLALSGVIAANTAMDNASSAMDWSMVDVKKFASELFRLIGYGLDFGNKEAYVIPYRNNKTGKYDLTTPVSADGLVKLAKMYAVGKKIEDFKKFFVREGDNFSYSETSQGGTEWEYKPILFNAKPILGFATIVVYADKTSDVLITTHEDVARHRKSSKAPDSPAWKLHFDAMGMKCAVRRHMKKININLPQEFDDEEIFEPITKDCGDLDSPKVALDYPALKKQAEVEEAEMGDAYEYEQISFEGTPFAEEVK